MNRLPYQPPQTSMERHIAGLVEELRHKEHRRSEFAAMIEAAMAHAFWLESECKRLREDNDVLEKKMALGIPKLTGDWKETLETMGMSLIYTYDWYLEPQRWRSQMRPWQAQADETMWLRIRRATYKQLIKRIREHFEKTFPKVPDNEMRRRAEDMAGLTR